MSKNTVKPALTRNRRSRTGHRRSYTAFVLLLRFLSGRALDGRRCSNATFWSPGTRRIGPPAYLVTWRWWALAAGWQRAGIRLTATFAALLVLAGVLTR